MRQLRGPTLFPYTTLFRSSLRSAPTPDDDGPRRGDVLPTHRPHIPLDLLRHCNLPGGLRPPTGRRSEEHTSELQSLTHLVCRLLPVIKKQKGSCHRPPHSY